MEKQKSYELFKSVHKHIVKGIFLEKKKPREDQRTPHANDLANIVIAFTQFVAQKVHGYFKIEVNGEKIEREKNNVQIEEKKLATQKQK